jgi:hypothetical protein
MSSPSADIHIPCCSPATTESVAVVRDKVADARADVLIGQGAHTSAILRDANVNAANVISSVDRNAFAGMAQTDKFGLAGLQTTHSEADRLGGQASTIAWNQAGITGAGFAESRAQVGDSFGRLAAQGENGFYRTGVALSAGFSDIGRGVSDSYARLSEQNCGIKETVAAYGNRTSDQTATVLATLSGQHANITRDIATAADRLGLQAATQYGSLQLEASKNTRDIQMQAACNAKESLLEQSKWFALAEKTAMVNKCELEAKLAACCCEIKETVTGTANATQALIQATDAARVRDALAAAATENAILKLRREEHHHYPPYYHGGHGGHGSRRGSRSS